MKAMDRTFAMLIDGAAVAGAGNFPVINPATGRPFAHCPHADRALLDRAVAAGVAAFPRWAATPVDDRAALVARLADALATRADEFAALLTAEQGKPLAQAGHEVAGAVETLRAFAAMRPESRVLRDDGRARIVEHRTPLGVVAAIVPWNYPLLLLMNKIGPGLVAGNCIVAKPAPTTPLTALLFGEICRELLPPGVVNIICDRNDLGDALTGHSDIAMLSFTGSTATGRKVMAAGAQAIRRVSLELGGNDAAIVLDDADPVVAARRIFAGAMMNAGQVCVAIKRAYVPETMMEPFCDELVRLAQAHVVDNGARQGAQMGPLQNAAQYEKVKALLAETAEQGRVLAGGAAIDRPGYFIAPTIVRDLPDDARLVREEQFGPVLPVLSYSDIDEAVARADAGVYGLGGSVWGHDVDRAAQVAMRMGSGTVWINQHAALDAAIPFRGARQSGMGGDLGQDGLHEYTQAHIVNIALGRGV